MKKSLKQMKLESEFSYLAFLRRKRRDNRDSAKDNNDYSIPTIPETTTLTTSTTTNNNNNNNDDNTLQMKPAALLPSLSERSQTSIRLDEFGFITNLDENGQLHKTIGFVLPGGAATPSFDLYSTYSELRKNESKLYQQNLLDNKKVLNGRSINVRREKKWTIMLNDWNNTKLKKKKIRRRLRKGVPNSVRGQAWVHIRGVKQKVEIDQRGFYRELVRRSSGTNSYVETVNDVELQVTNSSQHKYDIDNNVSKKKDQNNNNNNNLVEVIERDINRTFPRHHMFFDGCNDDTSDEDNTNNNNHSDSDDDSADEDSYDVASANGEKSLRNELEDLENSSLHMEMLIKQSEDIDDLYSTRISPEKSKNKPTNNNLPTEDTNTKPTSNNSINDTSNSNDNQSEETSNGYGQKASQQLSLSRVLDHIETGNIPCNSAMRQARQNKETKKLSVTNVFSSVSSVVSNATKKNIVKPKQATKKEKIQSDYEVAKGGQASLRRVLRAYNIYDSDVGYCQGMNFIAAMFITYMSEEEAFWMLVAVMNDSPCKMRGLFGEGMLEAHQVLYVADKLIYLHNPKLAQHLENENIHVTMYATQWLLTLYTSSFPFALVTRVWDCFLAEGWKVPYRVMLALLDKASPDLLKLQFEEILGYIRELPLKVDGEEIMEIAFKIPLRWKQIQKYAKEYADSNK